MGVIHKYELKHGLNTFRLSINTTILSAKAIGDHIFIWVLKHDPTDQTVKDYYVNVAGTGEEMDSHHTKHGDTIFIEDFYSEYPEQYTFEFLDTVVMDNNLVWHVFELFKEED